jgi:hypothetical protein
MVTTQMATVYTQLGGCDYSGCKRSPTGWYWKDDETAMNGIRRTIATAIAGM